MKRLCFTFLMLVFGLLAQAQSISVKEFYCAENDLTARYHGTSVEDQNGNICALIKVETIEKGLWSFDVGALGVTKTEFQNANHPAEIWVYVPFGVTWISIQHEQLGKLSRYNFPCSIEKGCTYVMKLTTGRVKTIVEEAVMQQYLTFQISPANAMLEVDGKLWEVDADGTATQFVDFGTYSYRVQAPNYQTEVGKVTVNDPDNAHKVPVRLKSDLVSVTLQVDADAEIWINNEKKGIRTWTGALGKGTYKMECKQANHESTLTTQKITADMDGQTITLPAPTPIYGSLIIESTPNYATIYLDGKAMGETPKFVKEILVGEHEVKLTKEGCLDYVGAVTISRGEQQQIKAQLEKDGTSSVVINDVQEEQVVVETPTVVTPEKRIVQKDFRKKGFVMRPEMDLSENSERIGPTISLSLGYQFNPHFYLGFFGGAGFRFDPGTSTDSFFPLGLDGCWYMLNRSGSPIVGIKIGTYASMWQNDRHDFWFDSGIDYLKSYIGYAFNNLEIACGGEMLEWYLLSFSIDFSYRFGFSSSKGKK